jgi:hypothetical protein
MQIDVIDGLYFYAALPLSYTYQIDRWGESNSRGRVESQMNAVDNPKLNIHIDLGMACCILSTNCCQANQRPSLFFEGFFVAI